MSFPRYPERCLRGNSRCQPYSQIASNVGLVEDQSFFCCGKHDGTMAPVAQDKYTLCFKGPHRDDMVFMDRRDLVDQAHVILAALSFIELDMMEEKDEEITHLKSVISGQRIAISYATILNNGLSNNEPVDRILREVYLKYQGEDE